MEITKKIQCQQNRMHTRWWKMTMMLPVWFRHEKAHGTMKGDFGAASRGAWGQLNQAVSMLLATP